MEAFSIDRMCVAKGRLGTNDRRCLIKMSRGPQRQSPSSICRKVGRNVAGRDAPVDSV